MTAKVVTWLGEDIEPENEEGQTIPGPSFNHWGSIRFDKGKPVLIDDGEGDPVFRELKAHILAMAPGNRFYKVEDVSEHKSEAAEPKAPSPPKPKAAPRR